MFKQHLLSYVTVSRTTLREPSQLYVKERRGMSRDIEGSSFLSDCLISDKIYCVVNTRNGSPTLSRVADAGSPKFVGHARERERERDRKGYPRVSVRALCSSRAIRDKKFSRVSEKCSVAGKLERIQRRIITRTS